MISDRQAKEREMRKEQILESALNVFKTTGLDGTTMDEIAKQADFGKATLYYYFSSKEEIFIELLDRGWKTIWESIEPVIHENENPKDTCKVSFKSVSAVKKTFSSSCFKSKSHVRRSQIINLLHQRVRAAYRNAKDPKTKARLKKAYDYAKKRKESSKKKTQRLRKKKK